MSQIYKSRTGKTSSSPETVYSFLSDFRNFEHLIPADKVESWQTDGDTRSFDLPGAGRVGLQYSEKKPYELIRIAGDSSAKIPFTLEIRIRGESGDLKQLLQDAKVGTE